MSIARQLWPALRATLEAFDWALLFVVAGLLLVLAMVCWPLYGISLKRTAPLNSEHLAYESSIAAAAVKREVPISVVGTTAPAVFCASGLASN